MRHHNLVAMQTATLCIALLVCFCFPPRGLAANPSLTIEVVPHWKTGDIFHLEVTRSRDKSVDGRSTRMGATHTPFTIEVLSASKTRYLVGWTAGPITFGPPAPAEHSFLRQVADVMRGQQIILEIDGRGTITGVQNWKALKMSTLKAMETISEATRGTQPEKVDQPLASRLRIQWEAMLSTKEQVERLCTREAQIYLMVLGRRYTLNKPYAYTSLLPNPLDGEAFPAHATMTLKTFTSRSEQAMIQWNQTADPIESARILRSTFKNMTARLGQSQPQGEFPPSIAMQDTANVVVNVKTGWVTSLTHTQSLSLGKQRQVDTTTIVGTTK